MFSYIHTLIHIPKQLIPDRRDFDTHCSSGPSNKNNLLILPVLLQRPVYIELLIQINATHFNTPNIWIGFDTTCTVCIILLLHEWRWAWLHAWWVLRWLLNPIWALNRREQCGHGCSCCPGDGGFWALSLRRHRFSMAFWIRSFSYSVTPERTLLRQAGRSDASSSQALWSKPQRFRETFSVSLKRFFWPPLERFPAQSSPYRSCFGRRSSGIRTTCPAHLSCDLISMAWMLSIPACCSTSVSGM